MDNRNLEGYVIFKLLVIGFLLWIFFYPEVFVDRYESIFLCEAGSLLLAVKMFSDIAEKLVKK